MQATVVITTKDRKEDLVKAVASALEQTIKPEVLVIDDGSTDGTSEMIRRTYPSVRLHREETSRGYMVQRNRAARLATGDFIVSIDDDGVFSTPKIIETTLGEFGHPRVGAVAIPSIDINRSPAVRHRAPSAKGIYATYTYIGTAHAVRRDLFLGLSGYREILFHQGEEEDYCLRLLEAGYITRLGNSDPIHHFESPRRSFARMDYYGARNKVLYAWHNVPAPALALHLAGTTAKTLLYTPQPRRAWIRLQGVLAAYGLCIRNRAVRCPVAQDTYRLSRELKQRGAVPLDEIMDQLKSTLAPCGANCHAWEPTNAN